MVMNESMQKVYAKILARIDKVFRKANIQYWLDAGTLLCAYRDGNLEYEHDIDIGVYGEDYDKIVDMSKTISDEVGCKMSSSPFYHTLQFQIFQGVKLHCDIIQWHASGDIRTCWGVRLPFVVPSGMLDEFIEIKLEDLSETSFYAPKETERYLEMYYGKEDWKKPMPCHEYHNYQMNAYENNGPRYEINRYNSDCAEFWERRLGREVDWLHVKRPEGMEDMDE